MRDQIDQIRKDMLRMQRHVETELEENSISGKRFNTLSRYHIKEYKAFVTKYRLHPSIYIQYLLVTVIPFYTIASQSNSQDLKYLNACLWMLTD